MPLSPKAEEVQGWLKKSLKIDPSLKTFLEDAAELSPYATIFRYPGDGEEPSMDDAIDALELAENVYLEIVARLPQEIKS